MSTYAYPAFRPEASGPHGTFGIPSFGGLGGFGAILGPAPTLVPPWRQKVAALRAKVTAFADAIKKQVVAGQSKTFILDMVNDATTALNSAMNWLNVKDNFGTMWTTDDESRLRNWYEEAESSYQGAVRVVETTELSFLVPKDKVAIPGTAFVASVPSGGTTGATITSIVKSVTDSLNAIATTGKTPTAQDVQDAATTTAQVVEEAGGTPQQAHDAAKRTVAGAGGLFGLPKWAVAVGGLTLLGVGGFLMFRGVRGR